MYTCNYFQKKCVLKISSVSWNQESEKWLQIKKFYKMNYDTTNILVNFWEKLMAEGFDMHDLAPEMIQMNF